MAGRWEFSQSQGVQTHSLQLVYTYVKAMDTATVNCLLPNDREERQMCAFSGHYKTWLGVSRETHWANTS